MLRFVLVLLASLILLFLTFTACSPSPTPCETVECNGICCDQGEVCHGDACCTPTTCEGEGFVCGPLSDGCGSELYCGGCPEGMGCNTENGTCEIDPTCNNGGATGGFCDLQTQWCNASTGICEACDETYLPQQVLSTIADGALSVYATDLDGDGDADVLSASSNELNGKIAWYENLGGGSFGIQQVITTSADMARLVYAADLDGDGDADVLSASSRDDKIAWYEKCGHGM